MIASMTAFSRQTFEAEWGAVTWELRTVNHRYLEVDIKLPEMLREMEGSLKDALSSVLNRGKVNCFLKYSPATIINGMEINKTVLGELAKASTEIEEVWGSSVAISMTDLMHWPGVMQAPEVDKALLHGAVLEKFKQALEEIVAMRKKEGEGLCSIIESRLNEVLQEVDKIKTRLPIVMKQQREKICNRMEELALSIDPKRLEEELLFLIQKMDVTEEIDRLALHVQEVKQALEGGRPVGRRLDFLMQELHREANTLGSKSADAEVTHAAIHLKVLIEQMREQVQNVE